MTMPLYTFQCPECLSRATAQNIPEAWVDTVKLGCPQGHGAMTRLRDAVEDDAPPGVTMNPIIVEND